MAEKMIRTDDFEKNEIRSEFVRSSEILFYNKTCDSRNTSTTPPPPKKETEMYAVYTSQLV